MLIKLGEAIQGIVDFKVRGRAFRIQINPPNEFGYRYMRLESLETKQFYDALMPPQESSSDFIGKALAIIGGKERNTEEAKRTALAYSTGD